MAYDSLKTAIRNAIYDNGNEEITGSVLRTVLLGIVDVVGEGYRFAGTATPTINPGTPQYPCFWIGAKGTYANFGSPTIEVNGGELGVFMWNGTEFSKNVLKVGGDGAFDISDYTGNSYASLSAALADIPQGEQKGGMTIKYIQSSDNKYVQYFLAKDEWSTSVGDWEKMNLEEEISQLGQEFWVKSKVKLVLSFIDNEYVDATGIHTSQGFGRTDFIDVNNIREIKYNAAQSSYYNVWFDANKTPIYSAFNVSVGEHNLRVPLGASYVIFSTYASTIKLIELTAQEICDIKSLVKGIIFDVNAFNKKTDGYTTKQDARNAVPVSQRFQEMVIRYLLTDGCWYTEKYVLNSINGDIETYWASSEYLWTLIEKYDPKAYQGEINDIRDRVYAIDGEFDSYPKMINGVPWNGGNPNFVQFSDYIEIKKGIVIKSTIHKTIPSGFTDFAYGYAVYDKNLTLLNYQAPAYNNNEFLVEAEDAFYVKCCYGVLNGNTAGVTRISDGTGVNLVLADGDVSYNLSYEGVKYNSLASTTDRENRIRNKEQLPYQLIYRSYVELNGTIVNDYNGFIRTSYIDLSGLESLIIDAPGNSNYNVFFDKNKNPIRSFSFVTGINEQFFGEEAKYAILSGYASRMLGTKIYGKAYLNYPKIVKSNISKESAILSASYHGIGLANRKKNLTLVWGSDFHGSITALQSLLDIGEFYQVIDGIVNTGDVQLTDPTGPNVMSYLNTNNLTKPFLNVIGNHDNGYGDNVSKMATAEIKYERYIEPFIELGGFVQPSDLSDYPCYYYKDFTSYKIRIIGVDVYDVPKVAYDGGSKIANQDITCVGEKQANFIANALLNVPEDYSVIIIQHTSAGIINVVDNKFSQAGIVQSGENMAIDHNIVEELIHSFVEKESLSVNVKYIGSAKEALDANELPNNYTVTADFSSRVTSNFICVLAGHTHRDLVGINTLAEQLNIVISCASTNVDQSSFSDIAKDDSRMINTLFNVISFDTDNKKISLVRIGADTTIQMSKRDMVQLDY